MSDDKDDLRSIKVYKFNNTKENWHEFALKFRVIDDSRGYEDIIDGTVTPPDEKEHNEILSDDKVPEQKAKKEKLTTRLANKKEGYRDLVMSTEGISLNIVEKCHIRQIKQGRFKKSKGKTQEEVESENQRGQSGSLHTVLEL